MALAGEGEEIAEFSDDEDWEAKENDVFVKVGVGLGELVESGSVVRVEGYAEWV